MCLALTLYHTRNSLLDVLIGLQRNHSLSEDFPVLEDEESTPSQCETTPKNIIEGHRACRVRGHGYGSIAHA
jgi:hypothetical protein